MAREQQEETGGRIRVAFIPLLVAYLLAMPPWAKAGGCDAAPADSTPHRLAHVCPSNPDVLYKIAQACTQSLQVNKSCRARGPRKDYIILKDNSPRKPKGYLLIPVQCVTGVEDGQVLAEPVVDFWRSAWIWSRRELPGLPASRIGVAVNSLGARGNDQLHFHLSCVDPDVARTLRRNQARIPEYSAQAKPLRIALAARHNSYTVVKVRGLAGESSPFHVVEGLHGGEQSEMGRQGIAVVAATRKGEYYVLNTSEDDGGGHAEEILDQRCR